MTEEQRYYPCADLPAGEHSIRCQCKSDDYICPGCFEDMRSDDHFGCSYCGSCVCQGGC